MSKKNIILIGKSGSGKSAWVKRLIQNDSAFLEEHVSTLGVNSHFFTLDNDLSLQIYDASGQEKLQRVVSQYLPYAQLMYYFIDAHALLTAQDNDFLSIVNDLAHRVSNGIPVVLVFNKMDLIPSKCAIDFQKSVKKLQSLLKPICCIEDIPILYTSAKNNTIACESQNQWIASNNLAQGFREHTQITSKPIKSLAKSKVSAKKVLAVIAALLFLPITLFMSFIILLSPWRRSAITAVKSLFFNQVKPLDEKPEQFSQVIQVMNYQSLYQREGFRKSTQIHTETQQPPIHAYEFCYGKGTKRKNQHMNSSDYSKSLYLDL